MNDKYYTPELSEFHMGFIYEWYYNDEWQKDVFGNYELTNTDRDGEWYHPSLLWTEVQDEKERIKKYRVKHLDEEDIIACGVENKGYSGILKSTCFQGEINGKDYQLTLRDNGTVKIEWQDWEDEKLRMLFDGEIKNINELKFQMKRLNIPT